MPRKAFQFGLGTGWFLAILLIAAITAVWPVEQVWSSLILAICGAAVAILNIRIAEERAFLLAVTALIVIIIALVQLVPMAAGFDNFLVGLLIAFGVAGFIVALSEIAKLGLTR